jgi:hypothetical protein
MPPAMLWQAGTPCSRSQCTTFKLRTPWWQKTINVDVGLGFQLLQVGWDVPHRDQRCAFDARDGEFLRLANVNQYQRFSGVDAALDVLRAGFEGKDRFRSRMAAVHHTGESSSPAYHFIEDDSFPSGKHPSVRAPLCYLRGSEWVWGCWPRFMRASVARREVPIRRGR